MKVFYRCINNGVTAVVSEEVFRQIQACLDEMTKAGGWTNIPYPKPVFTFADNPTREHWVTGAYDDMDRVLEGHEVRRDSFYVPFSNGIEYSSGEQGDREREFHTTLGEAMEAFGLVRAA